MKQRKEFRAYMKAANSTSDNYDDSHLSEAQMIAYCRGEVSVVERENVQAHLVECVQCIALFRNARDAERTAVRLANGDLELAA